MKATGEVMAISRSFEGGLLKAIRCLEIGQVGLRPKNADRLSEMDIETGLTSATDQRLFLIAEAFHRGMLVQEVADLSGVDPWFLTKIQKLVQFEENLRVHWPKFKPFEPLTEDARTLLAEAKILGFSDRYLASVFAVQESHVRGWVQEIGLRPAYKMVDTCAAEFEAATPYFYSCYEAESE